MQNYSGFSGRIRILKERIQNWISKNGTPPVGSRAWEAKLEVEKLPRIIDERLERLSKGDLDADAQANLRADIENLQQQLATHQKTLDEMDTNPGVGFVAAEANPRVDIIEVGAGEGHYSQSLRNEFLQEGEQFLATDVANEPDQGGFLKQAEAAGIAIQYGVDANELHNIFPPKSIRIIAGANPYGAGPAHPGQSYGLAKFTGQKQKMEPDHRFLDSAHKVLRNGGKAILRCKSNILRKYINSNQTIKAQQKQALNDLIPELVGTNPYTRVKPKDLLTFAEIGYEITVTQATPPDNVSFGRPDTDPGKGVELEPFNVEITFQKSETPKVIYKIGDQKFEETPR
jgi:hypothetical protein